MNGEKLKPELKETILKQGYLYRGTYDSIFKLKQESGHLYYGRTENGRKTTSTGGSLIYAMVYGVRTCRNHPEENAKPVLLAIAVEKYINSIRDGLEGPSETKIEGMIDWEDIVVVDSLDKLLRVCPGAHPKAVDYFKEHYLGQKDA